jgi:hypothetical protein
VRTIDGTADTTSTALPTPPQGEHMRRSVAFVAVLTLGLAACGNDDGDAAAEGADAVAEEATEEVMEPEEYTVTAQPDAAATFVSPSDGDTVTSPFTVELAAEGIELVPAGEPMAGEGHLHVLADIGCYETGEVIPGPSDEDEAEGRFHLGDGSDTREITLEPGDYELCVQLADGVHTAFGETETIAVTVE